MTPARRRAGEHGKSWCAAPRRSPPGRALLALLAVAACHRSPSRAAPPATPDAAPPVEVVRVEDVAVKSAAWPAKAGPEPDPRALARKAWEELVQSPDFMAGPGLDAGLKLRVRDARVQMEYGVGVVDGTLRSVVTLALQWTEDDETLAPWSSQGCETPAPDADRDLPAAAASAVECALGSAARDLALKEAVRRGRESDVLAALESPDPSLRRVAFAAIGEHRIRAAVPRLLQMLHSEDVLVRDGAIGALVALRERSAVRPLIELARFKDLDMMRRIIDAVGAIGGEEAQSYLELVASGHELEAVRELAAQALDRLQRHRIDAHP